MGTYLGKTYLYAEDEFHQTNWGKGSVQFCVNKTAAFAIANADAAACTDSALKKVKSQALDITGTTTWNVSPILRSVNFCNQVPGLTVFASFAKNTDAGWQSIGWYELKPQTCKAANLGKYTGDMYYYAEYNQGEMVWGDGPFQYCVDKTNAFQLPNGPSQSMYEH